MTLWIALGTMCLLATLFVVLPFYRNQEKVSTLAVAAVVLVVAGSAGLYARQGSPDLPSVAGGGGQSLPEIEDVVEQLAARLEAEPDDLDGWKMLGRSAMQIEDYARAVQAFERANAIENSRNADTLVELGESLLARDSAAVQGRIASLFESALALQPNHPTGLFYGGIGALNQGNRELAADRWEALLAQNPPPEVRHILEMRIAEWRGEAPPEPVQAPAVPDTVTGGNSEAGAAPSPATPADTQAGGGAVIISAAVSVSGEAAAALPADAVVFVIARDPAQPSPPIAVKRLSLSQLPDTVRLSDGDSMMAGRALSGFDEIEVLVRVSLSGGPAERSGDWYGSTVVRPAETGSVALSIDQQVP